MVALVKSESSFGAYACHRRPGGSLATSDLIRCLGLKRIVRIFANIRISLNGTNIFRGSNSSRQRSFHFPAICAETLHRRTLPRARWAPDRDRRNDSNRPTHSGSSYRLPVLLKATLFLLFWLIKKKKRNDDASISIFENATASPGFCCKLRLPTLVSLEVEFFLSFTMQAGWFQG